MRIIGGYARGIRLSAPDGLSLRPTEETVFSMLGDISGMTVADLFSGTGAMGLEALSRGAACVKSIELNPLHADFIQRNYDAVAKSMGENLSKGAFELIRGDVFRFLKTCHQQFDIIFADPPYALKELPTIPDIIFEKDLLRPGGLFVFEHGKDHDFSEHPHFVEHRSYGSVNFSLFR